MVPVWVWIIAAVGVSMSALPSIAGFNAKRYDPQIRAASARYGVPRALIYGVIAAESSFNPLATGKGSSARGLMQVTKAAAAEVGADWSKLLDPTANINAGTAYLSRMLRTFGGDELQAIRAYYEGPGARAKHSDADPSNDNPQRMIESAAYANKVVGYAKSFEVNGGIPWSIG